MKLCLLLTIAVILVNCSINHPISKDKLHESGFINNNSGLDSIFVESGYKPVGKIENIRFSSMFDNYPFPIEKYPPKYSKFAIDNHIEGVVILQIEVLADGSVARVLVKQSLMPGPGGLDEAAVNSVKKWKYSPAKYEGKPVASWTTFPIRFELK